MTDFHELVKIPPAPDINTGLSAAKPFTMLSLFGKPGRLTQDCSAITNPRLHKQIVTHHFNNFSVTGWKPAIDALVAAMTQLYQEQPDLHEVIRTAGMLCCRAVRGSTSHFSSHAFGTAIDIEIGSQLDQMGERVVQRGILMAYPYFHRQGFYWGAAFTRPDGMHLELADETVRRLYHQYYG